MNGLHIYTTPTVTTEGESVAVVARSPRDAAKVYAASGIEPTVIGWQQEPDDASTTIDGDHGPEVVTHRHIIDAIGRGIAWRAAV